MLGLMLLVVAGCTSEVATTTTSGSEPGPGGTTNTTEVGGAETPDTTTTTLRGQVITEHNQVHTEETNAGPILHVVIPRGGYSDIDVENFIRDLRDSHPGLWGVELFDNVDAQAAFMVDADRRSEEQRTLVARHHLLTLSEGERVTWRGPFSSLGRSTLGS